MKTVAAVIGAIVMVAAAVFVRDRVIEGDSASEPARAVTIVCATELAAMCAAAPDANVRVEAAGTTADALTKTGDIEDVDVWVVPAPWPQLVDARRVAAGLDAVFGDDATAFAQTPLRLLVRAERLPVLANQCKVAPADVNWKCLGDVAGASWASIGGDATWGDVKPGVDDPVQSAVGLLVVSNALSQRVGSTDFGREVFDDPEISDWFTNLARSVPPAPVASTPLDRFLAVPASYDAVGDSNAAITTALTEANAARRNAFTVVDGGSARAVAVVAGLRGHADEARRVARDVSTGPGRRAIERAGWVNASDRAADTTGLPDGGTMQVVRERWAEALR